MNLNICKTAELLGKEAATLAAKRLREIIAAQGHARIVLSTGASQFPFFTYFTKENIDWSKVEMFHLDEYVALPESHIASFRKYLRERFVSQVGLQKAHYVNGEGDVTQNIAELTKQLREAPIDLALIGIGENGHIAFNDPPADFETRKAYMVVELDERCKQQQVGEGWFATVNDVPQQAITMTVHQILQSRAIISVVPHKVKAQAVKAALEQDLNNMLPATALKQHTDWTLFLDEESASLLTPELRSQA